MWSLLATFLAGLLTGMLAWWRGYREGLRKGRVEGRRAFVDERRDQFLASVLDHADLDAWEEEL